MEPVRDPLKVWEEKIVKQLLALTLTLMLVAGCSAPTVKLGLGMVASMGSSKEATAEADGKVQTDLSIVAAAFDANGKVLNVRIDALETSGAFDATGALKFDPAQEVKSKVEQGDDYGMKTISAIGKEIYEQYAALEAYMIGKTADEVIAMPLYQPDESHPTAPDAEELRTTCTINVGDFIKAFEKAYKAAK